jgi:diguanylate cyclase (GGDEF)-like protein
MNTLLLLGKSIFIPLMFFVAALLAAESLPNLPASWFPLLKGLPYVLMLASALLCIQFNQSRMIFSILCIFIFYLVLHFQLLPLTWLHVNLLVFWLLFNIAFLGQLRERSVLSVHSVIKAGVLLFEILLSWYVVRFQDQLVLSILDRSWIAISLPEYFIFSQGMLAFMFLAGSSLLLRFIFQPGPVEAALLVLYVMLAYLANSNSPENLLLAIISMAALMTFVAILFDSHKMAYRDELTGLRSRRALNQYLTGLGRKYTIAMMDIDHFKPFNDNHGHDVGDQMLKLVASKIAKVKGGGTPFRYGGEEFTVIFPRKSFEQVEEHLENLRLSIEGYPLHVRAKSRPEKAPKDKSLKKTKSGAKVLSCTISIGVASRSDKHKTPEEVMKAADSALYRAKKRGRNCVCQ